ncbi:MAG: RNA-binding domain-containing protein [Myxococcota bacterium]
METIDLFQIIKQGEDSTTQFKKNISNKDSLAAELVAFSNSLGGNLIIGVDDDGIITGLKHDDIKRINKMLSNVCSQNIRPSINPISQIKTFDEKQVMIIMVSKGINKPYSDKDGKIWVKSGADKRKATSREEIQRLFQESAMVHADISPARGMTISELDLKFFRDFFSNRYGESLDKQNLPLQQIIENLNLGKNGELNLTGALLFSNSPSLFFPEFIVKAVAYPGEAVSIDTYIDSRDLEGKISDIYKQSLGFVLNNLKQIQGDQGVNSIGKPEIPRVVLEELLVNALVHRNYFISAPVKLFVFSNRVEIISPGHLYNDLTIENIKNGVSNMRNPVLASYATHLLPYRGLGSGISRALKLYPTIEFIDDRKANLFKVIIKRKV